LNQHQTADPVQRCRHLLVRLELARKALARMQKEREGALITTRGRIDEYFKDLDRDIEYQQVKLNKIQAQVDVIDPEIKRQAAIPHKKKRSKT
jgi:hypothetical protein